MNRRQFLHSTTAAAALAATAAAAPPAGRPSLCIFSKHLADLDYVQLGKTAKEMGFDGVDLTVRAKGHVLPERAAADLPKCVGILRDAGVDVPMITTNITSADDPTARPILENAARLKIPFWKAGYFRYKETGVEATVAKVADETKRLAALAKEYGVTCGFHNHSGDHVGAAVWDVRQIIGPLDPKWIGYYYDPAHATIEGGLWGWKLSQDIVMPRLKMVALKDFYWQKQQTGKWKLQWAPMGEGMVDWTAVFNRLAKSGFAGPISLHVEYNPPDEPAAIRKDFAFIRKTVAAAYGS